MHISTAAAKHTTPTVTPLGGGRSPRSSGDVRIQLSMLRAAR